MRIQSTPENIFEDQSAFIQSGWKETLAHWLSIIGSPPFIALAGVTFIAVNQTTRAAWLWAVVYALLAVLAPVIYIVWLFWQGRVSDLDLYFREQRLRPLGVAVMSATAAWAIFHFGAAPHSLTVYAGASSLQMALIFGITLRWKISMHTSAIAGLAALLWVLLGSAAMPFTLTIPFIAWARIRLRRHTLAQTLAGAALGSILFTTAFLCYME